MLFYISFIQKRNILSWRVELRNRWRFLCRLLSLFGFYHKTFEACSSLLQDILFLVTGLLKLLPLCLVINAITSLSGNDASSLLDIFLNKYYLTGNDQSHYYILLLAFKCYNKTWKKKQFLINFGKLRLQLHLL